VIVVPGRLDATKCYDPRLCSASEMAPSCCIMPIMSQLAQLSTILPSEMRSMVIPVSRRVLGSSAPRP
jgi:hypothetical protein